MRSRSPANKRRLVAAGAGADLEHRRAVVGGVAGQELQRQRPLGLLELLLVLGQLLGGHGAELLVRVMGHLLERLGLVAQPPHLLRRDRDRLDLGIILGERTNCSAPRSPAAIAACNSSRRASICAIRSAEMRVMLRSLRLDEERP